jgi:hypothetical protein
MIYLLISFGIFLAFLLIDKALDLWSGKLSLDATYRVQQLQTQAEILKQDSHQSHKIEGFGKYSNSSNDPDEIEIPDEDPEI